jgi:hypothetical protein
MQQCRLYCLDLSDHEFRRKVIDVCADLDAVAEGKVACKSPDAVHAAFIAHHPTSS